MISPFRHNAPKPAASLITKALLPNVCPECFCATYEDKPWIEGVFRRFACGRSVYDNGSTKAATICSRRRTKMLKRALELACADVDRTKCPGHSSVHDRVSLYRQMAATELFTESEVER